MKTSKTISTMFALLAMIAATACGSDAQPAAPEPVTSPVAASQPAQQVIEMSVTAEGFVPAQIKVKVGQPVKLVVTRQVEGTCATEMVIKDYGINKPLPLNEAVEVELTATKPGQIRYACGMDMIAGVIIAE